MAKGNPILGGLTGSIGDITFFMRYGQQISRKRNREPANPRSPLQKQQRAALSLVTFTWQKIAPFGLVAYKKRAVGRSQANEFSRQNLNQAYMTVVLDPATDEYTATWLEGALKVQENPAQLGTSTVAVDGTDFNGTVTGLIASRQYVVYGICQSVSLEISKATKVALTASPAGVLSIAISTLPMGVNNPVWGAISVQDTVTGDVSNFIVPQA